MRNFFKIALWILIFSSMSAGALYAQSTTIKLPTIDSSSSFIITDSNNVTLMRLNGDGGYYIIGNTTYGPGIPPVSGAGTRLMWYPYKKSFRAGYVDGTQWDDANIGISSFAVGHGTTASMNYSSAMGNGATASGAASTAMGNSTTASGSSSVAAGEGATASGPSTVAMGYNTIASGVNSTAFGTYSIAGGQSSTAMGTGDTASGAGSVALGWANKASGDHSTAMGYYSTSTGNASMAMGYYSKASNTGATAMGDHTFANGIGATAGGQNSTATQTAATAMGRYAYAAATASTALGNYTSATGGYSVALGNNTTASGTYSSAMGNYVSTNGTSGSFIIGDGSTIVANSSVPNQMTMRFGGGYRLFTNAQCTTGVTLSAGGSSWSAVSDERKKEQFMKADGEYFLNSLSQLKLGSWNYIGQDSETFRHYGPMAQEIFKYFGSDGIGIIGNDTTLASADMDGIMMICLQALEKRTAELNTALNELKAEKEKEAKLQTSFDDLKEEIAKMKNEMRSLTEENNGQGNSNISLNTINKGQ